MDRSIERIERLNVLLIGVGAIVGWGTDLLHVPSVVLGGAVMGANFWLLKKVVRGFLSRPGERAKARAMFWLVGKAVFFLLLLSALFFRFSIRGGSFAVGVSLLLLACVIVSLCQTGRNGEGEKRRGGERVSSDSPTPRFSDSSSRSLSC